MTRTICIIQTWKTLCHRWVFYFKCRVKSHARPHWHPSITHACGTHSSCPHLSIDKGWEGARGVCPVSAAIFNSSTVRSPFSVGGCGRSWRTRNNIPFCAAQKQPEEGKLAEQSCGWLDPCCSPRTGISRVQSDSALMTRVTLLLVSSRGFSRLQGRLYWWELFQHIKLHFYQTIGWVCFSFWTLRTALTDFQHLLFITQVVTLPYCVCPQCCLVACACK